MKGVIRTRVGYAGGTKPEPTYHSLGDHTETLEIDYDPAVVSYGQLLDVFWNSHQPTSRAYSRQYMSAVFYRDEEQKGLAVESRDREAAKRNATIVTEIRPFTHFYLAEDYHQKYRLRNERELMREFTRMYPHGGDFVNSTAAARINGFLDGYGGIELLEEEVGRYGLSPEATKRLVDTVKNRSRAFRSF